MKTAEHPFRCTRLEVEQLEERLMLSWAGVPPPSIALPTAKYFRVNQYGLAKASSTISANEVDYRTFIAPVTQLYTIQATTPSSGLDPVLGVFDAGGLRIAYNDDISAANRDSQLAVQLTAGQRYYVAITNYSGTANGSYSWRVQGATGDDSYEPNDSFSQAANLGTLTGPLGVPDLVMADKRDWFRFTLGDAGTAADYVRISFSHSLGNLQLKLYNAAGTLLGASKTKTDIEQIGLNGLAAGTYYVKVFGYNGVKNPHYELDINVSQQGPGPGDDGYEENDAFGQAFNLGTLTTAQTYSGLVMADSQDWFRFTTTATAASTSDVTIQFQHAAGDLDLALYNSGGALLGRSEGVTNSETLSLAGLAAGTFYVQVYGYQGALNPAYTQFVDPAAAAAPPPASAFQIDLTFNSGMTAAQIAVFQQAADRWEQIIGGDLPNVTYNGQIIDDLRINASVVSIDGAGGILGQAGPTRLRSNYLPYLGMMQFDSADVANMQANGTFLDVILHEMGHVLGIGTVWSYLGLLAGAGTSNPRFVGAQATAEFNAIFGTSATGVPVENTGGGGTRDSHWRESTFANELMTGWISGSTRPLSRVTAASLADLGYAVNLGAADFYAPPGSVQASGTSGTGGSGASLMDGSGGGCGCGTCRMFTASLEKSVATIENGAVESPADPGFLLKNLGHDEEVEIAIPHSWRGDRLPAESSRHETTFDSAPTTSMSIKPIEWASDDAIEAGWFDAFLVKS